MFFAELCYIFWFYQMFIQIKFIVLFLLLRLKYIFCFLYLSAINCHFAL